MYVCDFYASLMTGSIQPMHQMSPTLCIPRNLSHVLLLSEIYWHAQFNQCSRRVPHCQMPLKNLHCVRIELMTIRLWDWRTACCTSEARNNIDWKEFSCKCHMIFFKRLPDWPARQLEPLSDIQKKKNGYTVILSHHFFFKCLCIRARLLDYFFIFQTWGSYLL